MLRSIGMMRSVVSWQADASAETYNTLNGHEISRTRMNNLMINIIFHVIPCIYVAITRITLNAEVTNK